MDMTGEYRIAAPRDKVWQSLNDPAILQQCIPGCEALEKVSDTELNGKVRAKVGPVSARFGGKVTLSDLDPPNSYRISGEGTGGAAGFAKGGAAVGLRDDNGATVLSYKAEANVGGKLAQLGSRLIDSTARKMADDFFARFATIVGAPGEPPQTPPGPAQAAPSEPPQPATAPREEQPQEAPQEPGPEPPPEITPTGQSTAAAALASVATSPAVLVRALWAAIAILLFAACYFALA